MGNEIFSHIYAPFGKRRSKFVERLFFPRTERMIQMAKDFAKSFYASRAWQKCRRAYIESRINIDGGLCEKCRTLPGYIVHHKIPLSPENINNPEITLNFDNLAFDCKECHDREEVHCFVRKDGLLVYFDENGDVLDKIHSPLFGDWG